MAQPPQIYNYIGPDKSNCWGIDEGQLVPLCCLGCGFFRFDLLRFSQTNPLDYGKNMYLCDDCSKKHCQLVKFINNNWRDQGYSSSDDYYNVLHKDLHGEIERLEKLYQKQIQKAIETRKWVVV